VVAHFQVVRLLQQRFSVVKTNP